MLKTRSSRRTDPKNWPNILNIWFELTIDFIKGNKRNGEISPRCDKRPKDKVDSIFHKLISDAYDRHQVLYIESILNL